MSGELHQRTIAELAPLLRTRRLSPVELVEATLARIGQLEVRLKAFITVTADSARREAAAAEAEIGRGDYRGPLHGVPLGLKDLIDVAGIPCTYGSLILRDRVPAEDATVVRRLRQAGAVLVGKHNLHEFAYGSTSENPHYGAARNPWKLDRVAGGSSGGTGVAVAAGLSMAGLGSDTAGSIRNPAACCGIVGLKPTFGRVSRKGVLPASWSLDHVGPMARTVADCALVLQAVAGFDPLDPSSEDRPVPDFLADLEEGVAGMRVGVPKEHYFDSVDPAVASTVRTAIQRFESMGARLVEVSLPHLRFSPAVADAISSSERCSWHGRWLKDRASEYGADVLNRLRVGLMVRASEYVDAQRIRSVIQADFAEAFRTVDVVVAPTCAVVAPPIGKAGEPYGPLKLVPRQVLGRPNQPASLAGIPALTLPCGLVDGLPVGLQILGPSWGEAVVFRVARAYERETEWHRLRPEL